jgi:hypothetical protein
MPEDYLPGNGYGKVKVYSATSATSENPVPVTSATSEPAALAVATAAADIIDASSSLCLAAGLLYVLLYYCNVARRRAVAAGVRAVPSPPVMSPCGSGSCCFPRAPPPVPLRAATRCLLRAVPNQRMHWGSRCSEPQRRPKWSSVLPPCSARSSSTRSSCAASCTQRSPLGRS